MQRQCSVVLSTITKSIEIQRAVILVFLTMGGQNYTFRLSLSGMTCIHTVVEDSF
jgi:hypothetical protein